MLLPLKMSLLMLRVRKKSLARGLIKGWLCHLRKREIPEWSVALFESSVATIASGRCIRVKELELAVSKLSASYKK